VGHNTFDPQFVVELFVQGKTMLRLMYSRRFPGSFHWAIAGLRGQIGFEQVLVTSCRSLQRLLQYEVKIMLKICKLAHLKGAERQ